MHYLYVDVGKKSQCQSLCDDINQSEIGSKVSGPILFLLTTEDTIHIHIYKYILYIKQFQSNSCLV